MSNKVTHLPDVPEGTHNDLYDINDTSRQEVWQYLENLRLSGTINMLESPLRLRQQFLVSKKESYQMFTDFDEYKKNQAKKGKHDA